MKRPGIKRGPYEMLEPQDYSGGGSGVVLIKAAEARVDVIELEEAEAEIVCRAHVDPAAEFHGVGIIRCAAHVQVAAAEKNVGEWRDAGRQTKLRAEHVRVHA